MVWDQEIAGSSPVYATMYCTIKKRECEYAMRITVQLDKEFDKAEGMREYTVCCAPNPKVYVSMDPCIWEDNETGEC